MFYKVKMVTANEVQTAHCYEVGISANSLGNFSRKERKCITEIVENELDVSLSQHDVSMTGQEGDGLAEVDEKDSNFTPVCEDVSAFFKNQYFSTQPQSDS